LQDEDPALSETTPSDTSNIVLLFLNVNEHPGRAAREGFETLEMKSLPLQSSHAGASQTQTLIALP